MIANQQCARSTFLVIKRVKLEWRLFQMGDLWNLREEDERDKGCARHNYSSSAVITARLRTDHKQWLKGCQVVEPEITFTGRDNNLQKE